MLAMPLLAYALYCAYRDREQTRDRLKARRNPYSHADALARAYKATQRMDYCGYSSMGRMYAGTTNSTARIRWHA